MRHRVVFGLLPVAIWGCYLLLSASQAHADVRPPRIAQLAERSELTVLAKVESVSGREGDEIRRARATVMEVWKGPKVNTVEYLVSPTFMCDISHADRGETVLLFLAKNKGGVWYIVWAGRGRMPLRNI